MLSAESCSGEWRLSLLGLQEKTVFFTACEPNLKFKRMPAREKGGGVRAAHVVRWRSSDHGFTLPRFLGMQHSSLHQWTPISSENRLSWTSFLVYHELIDTYRNEWTWKCSFNRARNVLRNNQPWKHWSVDEISSYLVSLVRWKHDTWSRIECIILKCRQQKICHAFFKVAKKISMKHTIPNILWDLKMAAEFQP